MHSIQNEISKSLSQYGLNPQEWQLKPVHAQLWLIQNKDDHEIQLLAELSAQKDPSTCLLKLQSLQFLPI